MSASQPEPQPTEVSPSRIDSIRVELLSTELPVHQLAKRGQEEIRIVQRKVAGGQVTLYWKVEPNSAAGRPGQLAYHLDTWVINRRLDELGRPIPRLIRIGDLREIARDLGHGGDTNAIKRAFEQNASTFIRAKVAYRTKDGTEETLEGYFNRYNAFFRGQRLPGGHAAETVYISLNDPYFGLLNNSPRRPLDYQYLRQLAPASQRFYELVSPKFFAAIKNGHPNAWLRYSDYCLRAVQKRQDSRRRMQIQMAVVHRPHLRAGYLTDVAYRPATSPDGSRDWIISYTPGPRARAEFDAFNRTPWTSRRAASPRLAVESFLAPEPVSRPAPSPQSITPETSPAVVLATRFVELRYGTRPQLVTSTQIKRAEDILAALEADFDLAVIAIDIAAKEGRDDPKGFPKHLGGVLEGGYPERARAIRDADERRRHAANEQLREKARKARYDSWREQRAAGRIAALPPEARQQLVEDRLPELTHRYRFYLRHQPWSHERVRDWAAPRVLLDYGREGEPTYAEWCKRYGTERSTGTSGPDEALQ
jgi:hypothetical protein